MFSLVTLPFISVENNQLHRSSCFYVDDLESHRHHSMLYTSKSSLVLEHQDSIETQFCCNKEIATMLVIVRK